MFKMPQPQNMNLQMVETDDDGGHMSADYPRTINHIECGEHVLGVAKM